MEKFEFVFFSLYNTGAANAINRAGAKGYRFAGTAADVIILTRKVEEDPATVPAPRARSTRIKATLSARRAGISAHKFKTNISKEI